MCGYFDGEHNPEAHTAGRRAEANAYWEPPERDDDERDYGPADDAVCARCGQVGVDWNLEVDAARDLELPYVEKAGAAYEAEGVVWATVCTECERPADWPVNPDLRAC